ncbi:hypothetical protein LTR15_005733 [Elasticomyces elasticus]|nr:hypothetical protein LTR15_005733 [Elasticomyces elasticus]
MDPVQHVCNKLNAERARWQKNDATNDAPPAYVEADDDCESTEDTTDGEESGPPSPLKLTINAAHHIQGSNNLVPTSPSLLADTTRFSTLLLAAVSKLNEAAEGRKLNVNLTINCGITVVGDRNVVGNVGLKPKSPSRLEAATLSSTPSPVQAPRATTPSTTVGAKRRAEYDDDDSDCSDAKRMCSA